MVKIIKEKWPGRITEIIIGQNNNAVKAGGDSVLPFLTFEGEMPNQPVAALEVWDMEPVDWPDFLTASYTGVMCNPVAWAKKCVAYGAKLLCLKLAGTHPDIQDTSPEEAAATAKSVAEAVDVPLIITGCGIEEKDAAVLPVVGDALCGENVLLGCATENNYRVIAANCMANGHSLIASSPMDINLTKQLNILISEMNLPANRIAIDPLVGPLGYGLEYAYSIMERVRLGALMGDKMLAMPIVCFVGQEVWKTKEAKTEDNDEWGSQARRAVLWELVTAASLVQAGGSILILRHPESLKHFNNHITALTPKTRLTKGAPNGTNR